MTPARPSLRSSMTHVSALHCVFACGFALAVLACGGELEPGRLVPGELAFAPRSEPLGAFELRLEGTSWRDARVRAFHRNRPDEPVFETLPGVAFLEVARGRAEAVAGGIEDRQQERCADLSLDGIEAELYVLRISGRFRCTVLDRAFELFVVPEGSAELRFHLRLADASFNRIALLYGRAPGERFYGLGARDALALEARRYAVWVSRAEAPGPGLMGRLLGRTSPPPGSPAPVPHLLSSRGHATLLENPEYSTFDLRAPDRVRVETFARELTWRVQVGATPLELVEVATAAAGRAAPLAAWAHAGPIVLVRGGSAEVRRQLDALIGAGVSPAAFQIEDWFGVGSLDPDPQRYGDGSGLVAELKERGVRVVVETSAEFPVVERDAAMEALAAEADAAGYWVLGLDGVPYERGGRRWLDLSNPDARSWWVDVLQTQILRDGISGLVLAGGDGLPPDARLAAEKSGEAYHNRYAEAGVRSAARAFREADVPVDGLTLTATGFVRSPRHGAVLLAGDAGERATWARVVTAGLSGFAYAAVDVDGAAPAEARRRALGAAAFAPIFRVRADAFASAEALEDLAHAGRLHAAWSGFRGELARQARERGLPIVRAPWLHHPEVEGGDAFLVGDQLLVAPVFEPGAERVEIDLPPGRWVGAYTGKVHGLPRQRVRVTLEAPGGRAGLLYAEGSPVGRRLERALASGL